MAMDVDGAPVVGRRRRRRRGTSAPRGPLERQAIRQVHTNNTRARRFGLVADLTVDQWLQVLSDSGGRCVYCARMVGVTALVVEHRVPLSRDGGTTYSNVAAACAPCNGKKKG